TQETTMKKIIIASLAGLIATATFASSAMAANPFFCQIYANKAVHAEQKNLWEGCGFFGPRWSFNYGGHYSWCLIASPFQANAETNARKWMLASCCSAADPPVASPCDPPAPPAARWRGLSFAAVRWGRGRSAAQRPRRPKRPIRQSRRAGR